MEYVLRKKASLLLLDSAPLARLFVRSFALSLHPCLRRRSACPRLDVTLKFQRYLRQAYGVVLLVSHGELEPPAGP